MASNVNKNIILHKNIKEKFSEAIVIPWAENIDREIERLEDEGKDDEAESLRCDFSGDKYIENFEKKWLPFSKVEDYYLMEWKYQHQRWKNTNCPLFFDLGDDYIYHTKDIFSIGNGFIVKRFSKDYFIKHYQLNCCTSNE